MNEDFYVGYQSNAPQGISRFVKGVVAGIAILLVALGWLLARSQRGFISSTYQYAEESIIKGWLSDQPVPSIQVPLGKDHSTDLVQIIPIVQFGKIGGQELTRPWKDRARTWVRAKGHLIYYQGKALLEIPDGQNLQESQSPPGGAPPSLSLQGKTTQITLQGEILDAKCYFGVMKPGHGKPHRSCAIRCISGGIPAVLEVKDRANNQEYYLIKEVGGYKNMILDKVGERVTVRGTVQKIGDWPVLTLQNVISTDNKNNRDNIAAYDLSLCF